MREGRRIFSAQTGTSLRSAGLNPPNSQPSPPDKTNWPFAPPATWAVASSPSMIIKLRSTPIWMHAVWLGFVPQIVERLVAVLDANIASLYWRQMGEVDSAVQWLQAGMDRVKGGITGEHRKLLPQIQIEMGSLLARQEVLKTAPSVPSRSRHEAENSSSFSFQQGIDGADSEAGDRKLYAFGWNRLGEELLRQSDLPGAERALLEAYRVRKLNHLPMDSLYWNLGELRLAQGDITSASALLDRAVELTRRPVGPDAEMEQSFRRARPCSPGAGPPCGKPWTTCESRCDWRVPTAEVGSGESRHRSHRHRRHARSGLFRPDRGRGPAVLLETRDPALIRETFEAAEENRANSLRQIVTRGRRGRKPESRPPAYWEAIARLQRAEVAALRSKRPRYRTGREHCTRAEIVLMEASLVPGSQPLPVRLLDRAQAALRPDAALLSFHLGEVDLVAVGPGSGQPDALRIASAASGIEAQVQTATDAHSARILPAAHRRAPLALPDAFGLLAPRFQRKTEWLLALDEKLLNVPIAALPEKIQPRP